MIVISDRIATLIEICFSRGVFVGDDDFSNCEYSKQTNKHDPCLDLVDFVVLIVGSNMRWVFCD